MFMYQIITQDSAFNNFKILTCSRKISGNKIGKTTNTGSQQRSNRMVCRNQKQCTKRTHDIHLSTDDNDL